MINKCVIKMSSLTKSNDRSRWMLECHKRMNNRPPRRLTTIAAMANHNEEATIADLTVDLIDIFVG